MAENNNDSSTINKSENTSSITNIRSDSNKNEKFQFAIALIIIIGFFVFLTWVFPSNKDDSIKMISTLEGFVGMIIGFYFGQRPVQNLTKQVEDVSSMRAHLESQLKALEEKQRKTEKELLASKSLIDAGESALDAISDKYGKENKEKEENKSNNNNTPNGDEIK